MIDAQNAARRRSPDVFGAGGMKPIADLRCECGSSDICGVAPGSAEERAADLFTVSRGDPLRAWCAGCWRRGWKAP